MRLFDKDDLVKKVDSKGEVSLERVDAADQNFAFMQGEAYWQEDGARLGRTGPNDPRRIVKLTRDERELYS